MSRRLMEDFNDLLNCNNEDVGIAVVETDDLTELIVFIKGPEGTPYEGGKFKLRACVPESYPLDPPIHPNVSSATGYICLNVLASEWYGTMNLRAVVLSVQNLLANPVPDDAKNAVAGAQALKNPVVFSSVAQMWTHVYARGKKWDEGFMFVLQDLMETRSLSQEAALRELSDTDWGMSSDVECFN